MKVEVLHYTPLWVAARAIRKCWNSEDKSDTKTYYDPVGMEYHTICGDKDIELIERVGNKNKHASTLEHLSYSFDIQGISRACLQELARHRIQSLSVQSSRYTLSKILKNGVEGAYTKTGIVSIDEKVEEALITIANNSQIPNDKLKYMIPEAMHTSLVSTWNARSLQNFLQLRTSKSALWEIRDLANAMYEEIPDEHKYLFKDYICG